MVEYRGEPLARLKALRFNTVRLGQEPQPALLAEAAQVGMWIVAPPPLAAIGQAPAGHAAGAPAPVGPEYNPVLVWDLGAGWAAPDMDRVRQWTKALRAADGRQRPIAGGPETELREFSRQIDILLAERPVLGTTLELTNYGQWLGDRLLLARPGTPLWASVQTQPLARSQEQANLLAGRAVAEDRLQEEQVRQVVFLALAAGARGLTFLSSTPLDAEDAATKRRAELLELLNIELELIEPWAASGAFVTSAGATDGYTQAAVIQTERGRLLLPLRVAPQSQLAIGASQRPNTVYRGPWRARGERGLGTDTHRHAAFDSQARRRRLVGVAGRRPGRVDGRAHAGRAGDRLSFATRRRIRAARRRVGARSCPAAIEVRAGPRRAADEHRPRHAEDAVFRWKPPKALSARPRARRVRRPHRSGFTAARRAAENLQHIERAYWERGAALTPNWLATPLAANVATIPDQWLLGNDLPNRRPGVNSAGVWRLRKPARHDASRLATLPTHQRVEGRSKRRHSSRRGVDAQTTAQRQRLPEALGAPRVDGAGAGLGAGNGAGLAHHAPHSDAWRLTRLDPWLGEAQRAAPSAASTAS